MAAAPDTDPDTAAATDPELSDFEAATLAELVRLHHEGTMLGHQAMVLARRVSSDGESGATVAALSREHTRLMELVAARAKAQQDPVEKARSAAPYVYRGNAVPPERGAPAAAAS